MRSLIVLALLVFATAAGAQFHGKAVYEVGTATDFVRALGSDRTLRLTVNRIELPASNPGVVVRNLRNLRILGLKGGRTEVVGRSAAGVLVFTDCHNIDLRLLTIRLESSATSGVVALVGTTNVLLRECTLTGVDAAGLVLQNTAKVKLQDCAVANCGVGIVRAEDSRNVLITGSRFTRNVGTQGFRLERVFDLHVDRCEFTENTFKQELVSLAGGGAIVIAASEFQHDRYPRLAAKRDDVRVLANAVERR